MNSFIKLTMAIPVVSVILLWLGCGSKEEAKTEEKPEIKIETYAKKLDWKVSYIKPKIDTTVPEQNLIWELFTEWQQQQIDSGKFLSEEDCNPQHFEDHKEADILWGFPGNDEINFSFADINNDNILDGLVYFRPSQCDGGNASAWSQISVLFVSDEKNYRIEQNPVDGEPGIYFSGGGADDMVFVDSIAPNAIFGTSYGFLENDGHCCPSVEKRFRFDYENKKRYWE